MTPLPIASEGRSLGSSGIAISPLAWGMWRFRGEDAGHAASLVHAALEAGITLFDTADIYGPDNGEGFGAAEALLGRVLAAEPGLRARMVLATKGGIAMGMPYDSSAEGITRACEASLRRLGVEQVELYQIHRPDMLVHPSELAGALCRLRGAGKIAEVGLSNHSAAQTAALQNFLPFPLVSIQPEFSPLAPAPLFDGVLDQAMAGGMSVLAWSPLAGGRLARGGDGRADAVIALLDRIAAEQGVARAAVAYAWSMAHPARPIPIVGSQTASRIAEAAQAPHVRLSRQDWYAILTAGRGEALP